MEVSCVNYSKVVGFLLSSGHHSWDSHTKHIFNCYFQIKHLQELRELLQHHRAVKKIVETLKGADGLSSDISVVANQLSNFLDIERYAPDSLDSTSSLYGQYLNAIVSLNKVKESAGNFKQAYDNVSKNGGLNEPAIDEQGYVYVGVGGSTDIKRVSPIEYLENKDKYALLTNS